MKICSMLSALLGKLSGLKILSRLILSYAEASQDFSYLTKLLLSSNIFHYSISFKISHSMHLLGSFTAGSALRLYTTNPIGENMTNQMIKVS